MKNNKPLKIFVLLFTILSWCSSATEYLVESQHHFSETVAKLKAGDTVILKNGVWQNFEILFTGEGTQQQPITLTAQTKGEVIVSGQSNLRLAGKHLVVTGLVFKDGYTPSSAVIDFRKNSKELAFHSRVTEVVIDNFNNPDKQESDYWVALHGQHNRFDHNHLVGKRNKGVTVAVRLNTEQSQSNFHRIDHNYFGYRPVFGSNGGETLRIGTSHFSLSDSNTLVENNVFEHTNGEVEIISVKSGSNIIRGNVFLEAQGTLTLRHGNDNVVENNVFLGNGQPHTGGIRVINKGQTIRNNYLQGLTGHRFGSGFAVMNGVPDSPINRYHQVENATISHNSFIDVSHIQLAVGSDKERTAVPISSEFSNNLVINRQSNTSPFSLFDNVDGIAFRENLTNFAPDNAIACGFNVQSPALTASKSGLLVPKNDAIQFGISTDLKVVSKDDVGVAWYPKTSPLTAFDSGKEWKVDAKVEKLLTTFSQAKDGDTLVLAPGNYTVPKVLTLNKTLSLKSAQPNTVNITFERSTLFEIHDGGHLKLDGLTISGKQSPDAYGNSVIRTQKWGMLENYRLILENTTFVDLDTNHSFHVFQTGKGAFADQITLKNNRFETVTGHVLALATEIEDFGIYNAEYIDIDRNTFINIGGTVVDVYRGGTDESTFGPHLSFNGNTLNNVGKNKRNQRQASLFLHGVQMTDLADNTFIDSKPLVIDHTVGEPITAIINNVFRQTNAPTIVERYAEGAHTATLSGNRVE
jgi:poly(beta-D-mannuronate) lyase